MARTIHSQQQSKIKEKQQNSTKWMVCGCDCELVRGWVRVYVQKVFPIRMDRKAPQFFALYIIHCGFICPLFRQWWFSNKNKPNFQFILVISDITRNLRWNIWIMRIRAKIFILVVMCVVVAAASAAAKQQEKQTVAFSLSTEWKWNVLHFCALVVLATEMRI